MARIRRVAFQMDHVSTINIAGDSTFAMALEAQARGYDLYHYTPDRLIGRQVLAVVNFPPRRIGGFESQILVLGLPDENGAVVLLRPDIKVPDGGKMF